LDAKDFRIIPIDPELARLAIVNHVASPFRLWAVAHQCTRLHDGSGRVQKRDLKAILQALGIRYTRQHLHRIVKAGEGWLWNSTKKTLFIRSTAFVAECLTERTYYDHPEALTNKPGVKLIYVSPRGTLEEWEAMCYAAWFTHRDDPTISREVLTQLFGRTADTLRHWEDTRSSQITVRKNIAQLASLHDWQGSLEGTNAYLAHTPDGVTMRLWWQLPNTYKTRRIKQHVHKGQSPKVRRRVNAKLDQLRSNEPPAHSWRGGLLARLKRLSSGKRYVRNQKDAAYALKGQGGRVYLWRGHNRHSHGIYEPVNTPIPETSSKERLSFRNERALMQAGGLTLAL